MQLLRYDFSKNSLDIKIFGWIVRSVFYKDILEVKEEYSFPSEYWINPWPLHFLTIQRKNRFIGNLVINPKDRYAFIEQLKGMALK